MLTRGDVPEERNDGEGHPAHHSNVRERGHRFVKAGNEDRRWTVWISRGRG